MRRGLVAVLGLGVLALGVLASVGLAVRMLGGSEDEPPEAAVTQVDAATQVARGRYLALAGNCAACHTERGAAVYAGGRAIETPFGRVYASNLTPDRDTGIGAWSADDFWRALHHGKSKDGSLLYPAFPYPNFTRVTRADADALYVFLRTVPSVRQANRAHALRFPYDNRLLLAVWRALYFKPGAFRPDATRDAEWNRGAYLVQGLGHCNACHTQRNRLGGSDLGADLAGGMIPMLDWYAPALNADVVHGLGAWDAGEIVALLKTGIAARGAVSGPMAEVVYRSLQHLDNADLRAMANYLKSLPSPVAGGAVPGAASAADERQLAAGAKLYERHCVDCHGAEGRGYPTAYPPLAGNRSLTMVSPANPIRVVLNGGFPPGTSGNPRPFGMPPYRPSLDDEQVAAVVSYVRQAWGNRAAPVSPVEVDRFRAAPLD